MMHVPAKVLMTRGQDTAHEGAWGTNEELGPVGLLLPLVSSEQAFRLGPFDLGTGALVVCQKAEYFIIGILLVLFDYYVQHCCY
jgi:hypothetical protein